jgi:uncharacterized membrane protein YphA (DoxX/SURF4 family)
LILATPRVCPKPILIILGLFTRISAFIAEINMLVTAFVIHIQYLEIRSLSLNWMFYT